jgi:hemerythrin-like domain-containing protein
MPNLTVNHLRQDHQEVQSELKRLVTLLDELDADPRWTPERCEVFGTLCQFLTHGLDLLIQKQEEVLFPALEGLFQQREGPLHVLRGEHTVLRGHFLEVSRAGKALCRGEDKEQNLLTLCSAGRGGAEVLRDHLYKEDRVLFPIVARYLTPERDAELVAKMEGLTQASNASTVAGKK